MVEEVEVEVGLEVEVEVGVEVEAPISGHHNGSSPLFKTVHRPITRSKNSKARILLFSKGP